MQATLEQDAAVPDGELPDLRRRGGLDVQRSAAHRPHAQEDQGRRRAAVAPRELPRRHQGNGVPADAVRRVRAADARDGGEGRAADRRRAVDALHATSRRSTTGTTRASASSTTTSNEWAYIPHFYYDFYVYQYATSFTASAALSEGCSPATRGGETVPAIPSAGGSKYPIDLLKEAGVDMTTHEPFEADDEEDEPRDGRDGADSREAGEVARNPWVRTPVRQASRLSVRRGDRCPTVLTA